MKLITHEPVTSPSAVFLLEKLSVAPQGQSYTQGAGTPHR